MPLLTASVHWRELLTGHLVADFLIDHPRVYANLRQLQTEAKDPTPVPDVGRPLLVRTRADREDVRALREALAGMRAWFLKERASAGATCSRRDRRPHLNRIRIFAASGLLAIAAIAGAQSAATPSTNATTARARRPTPEMASVTGTVKQYRRGKSIVIVGPDGRGRKLVLDGTTRIDGPVARGQSVTAVWMTDDAGRPHVNLLSPYPRTSAETAASAATSGAASLAPSRETTPEETAVPPTATPHAPAEDATTPNARRTPLPGPS